MKKSALLSLLLVATLSISGVASAFGLAEALKPPTYKTKKDPNQAEQVKEEKKSSSVTKLEKTLADWVDAFNNKDIEALMSIYDEDITYASPDAGLIKGVDEVRALYKGYFSQLDGTLKYTQESVTEKGGMGVIVLKFYIEPNDKSKVEEAYTGRAMLVFKKKLFGKWFLLYDMDHTAPDILVEDFQ